VLEPFDPDKDGFHGGPSELVLVGPPGTGKTRSVLTSWLEPAVSAGLRAEDVLGCSYTTAAANEMRSRLADSTGMNNRALRRACKTIHSEALRLAREAGRCIAVYGDEDGSSGRNTDKLDEKLFVQVTLSDAAMEQPSDDLGIEIMEAIEADPDIDGWERLSRPEKELDAEARRLWDIARNRHPEALDEPTSLVLRRVMHLSDTRFGLFSLTSAVERYEANKQELSQIDFTDMLLEALKIEAPRRELLVIDEAQDLSPLQIAVARHWANSAAKVVWVGDPDQGIYGFAGADGTYLTSLIRSGVPSRRLSKSWRVPAEAHRLARTLIRRNVDRVDAPYEAADTEGEVVHYDWAERAICSVIQDGCPTMVLARSGRQLGVYARVLADEGEPFINERGASPLQAPKKIRVVRSIISIRRGLRIDATMAKSLVDKLPGRPKGLWFKDTKKTARAAVKELNDDTTVSPIDLEVLGVRVQPILDAASLEHALGLLGMASDCESLLRIIERHGAAALAQDPRIRLTTIHAAKGREEEVVLVDLAAPRPTLMDVDRGREQLETERRVLYVALTRVKRKLILVHPPSPGQSLGVVLGLSA